MKPRILLRWKYGVSEKVPIFTMTWRESESTDIYKVPIFTMTVPIWCGEKVPGLAFWSVQPSQWKNNLVEMLLFIAFCNTSQLECRFCPWPGATVKNIVFLFRATRRNLTYCTFEFEILRRTFNWRLRLYPRECVQLPWGVCSTTLGSTFNYPWE